MPTGVTATISQQSVLSGTVTITFTSSLAATAQNAPITIWGSSGSRVHSITFYVQVQPTQGTSVVTWATPQAITYGTPLGASQLNATLSVPGTCAYSPALGTVLTPGTRTLTATCTPTDTYNYTTPSPVTVSLTVAKVPLTITAASLTLAYKSAVPTITPVYTGFVNGESSTSLSKAPSCSTTTFLVDCGIARVLELLGSERRELHHRLCARHNHHRAGFTTITMGQTPASVAYGASAIALSATASSGLAVTFAGTAGVCTVSGTTLTIAIAGTCTVTASQAGNTNYSAATSVVRNIAVNPASLTISASSPTVVYGSPIPSSRRFTPDS